MDRRLAIRFPIALPVLCLSFFAPTRLLPPLPGDFVAFTLYWFAVLVPLILWSVGLKGAWRMLAPVSPGRALEIAGAGIAR